MAGTYPDVPGHRFAYDKDGTSMTFSRADGAGSIYTITTSSMSSLNKNSGTSSPLSIPDFGFGNTTANLTIFFPEKRNITGYYIQYSNTDYYSSSYTKIETSNDAINAQNGNWTTLVDPYIFDSGKADTSPFYRTNIQSVNWPNINCLRINTYRATRALHLYGSIASTESPDRLRIVDMSGNDIAAQLDFGDIRQRNNVTRQFRVVNNSDTKTANNITITLDTNPDASPTLIGQYQLSTDNTAYANAINIGTLAPGQSSGTLYVRDTVSASAQLGPWTLRIIASANTWS